MLILTLCNDIDDDTLTICINPFKLFTHIVNTNDVQLTYRWSRCRKAKTIDARISNQNINSKKE